MCWLLLTVHTLSTDGQMNDCCFHRFQNTKNFCVHRRSYFTAARSFIDYLKHCWFSPSAVRSRLREPTAGWSGSISAKTPTWWDLQFDWTGGGGRRWRLNVSFVTTFHSLQGYGIVTTRCQVSLKWAWKYRMNVKLKDKSYRPPICFVYFLFLFFCCFCLFF